MKIDYSILTIVVVGGQNPNIINHDFLTSQGIIDSTLKTPQSIITPPLSQLMYENFRITVDQERFVIDQKMTKNGKYFAHGIAKKYFSILKFTPVSAYGLNFGGQIDWVDEKNYTAFRDACFAKRETVSKSLGIKDWTVGFSVRYKATPFVVSVTIDPPADDWKCDFKTNCHRDFDGDGSELLVKELNSVSSPLDSVKQVVSDMLNGV